MYTHCPNCDTHFEISQDYLDIANGKVRCGKCDFIFNALDNLYEAHDSLASDMPEQDNPDSDNESTDLLAQLHEHTNDDISTDSPTVPTESLIDNSDTDTVNSVDINNIPFQFDTFKPSVPSTDIKEKMERIAASLSAATAELKSARQSATFHKSTAESIFSNEPNEESEDNTISETLEVAELEATSETEESPEFEATSEIEETTELEATSETEDSAKLEATSETEDSAELEATSETEDSAELEATSETEEPAELEATSEIEETAEFEATSETDESAELEAISETEEPPEFEATSETEESAEFEATSETEESAEFEATSETEESAELKATSETEDELEIVDYIDNDSVDTVSEYSPRSVDEGDIDILNSLMDNADQNTTSTDLLDELDGINQTLSSSNNSLDDEFSNKSDDFDDLDNGDDLLAELEQIESDFRKEDNNTRLDSTLDESIDDNLADDILSTDDSLLAEGALSADDSLLADDSLRADGTLRANGSLPANGSPLAESSLFNEQQDAGASSQVTSKSFQEEVVPSFLTQSNTSSSSPAAMLGWFTGTILLLLVLGAQYLHFNSVQFSQNPTFRPLLESLCPISNCSLPLVRTPGKIITVSHDVRSHPDVSNALEIQLRFKNKAAYTQAYPILEITFSNPLGEVIARRKFLPEEYLGSKDKAYFTQGLKANQTQEINLKIVDPDPDSLLSFQFNYL